MSLQDLGNIGEFMAAVAVVVSLVYLAVQIRQNTESVKNSAHLTSGRAAFDFNVVVASHPDIADLWYRGIKDPSALTPEESIRFGALVQALLNENAMLFRLHRRGLIDDDEWRSWEGIRTRYLELPGFRSMVRGTIGILPREFAEHVESMLQSRRPSEPAV